MHVNLVRGTPEHRGVLANLAQLYQYDFSEFEQGGVLNKAGLFPYVNLEPYWTEPDRHVFLAQVGGHWAGFVLLSKHSYLEPDSDTTEISEFFVMRKYRGQGVGDEMARQVFDMFPGRWELQVTPNNTHALHFWRRVVNDYTGGRYREVYLKAGWHGPVFSFGGEAGTL
jgi:predicted acetyltransferase